MIRFEKLAVNDVVVTLTENATIANPIYLFKFTNQQSNVDYYFTQVDTSTFKERYNQFSVTEKASPNTLAGEVEVGEDGFYDYHIYQTSLSSVSGFTEASEIVPYITKEVENGLVFVPIPTIVNTDYTPQSDTSIIYNPD